MTTAFDYAEIRDGVIREIVRSTQPRRMASIRIRKPGVIPAFRVDILV